MHLKYFQLHLGHPEVIDMKQLYCFGALHDNWQMKEDNSGEYKDDIYYTYSAEKALHLINDKYAELHSIDKVEVVEHLNNTTEERYFLRMRRGY